MKFSLGQESHVHRYVVGICRHCQHFALPARIYIRNCPVRFPVMGRCLVALKLEVGIVTGTHVNGVRIVVGIQRH